MSFSIKSIENFKDYSTVFKVFENFPFYEKWTEEEIKKEFDLNLANGHIFGYYENDNCLGFISMREQIPNEHPVHYKDTSKVVYLSDLAVLPKYRRQGIANHLLDYALSTAISEGYEYAYLRINSKTPMASDIAKKHGFHKEYDSYEIVSRPVVNDKLRQKENFRIFMTKKL